MDSLSSNLDRWCLHKSYVGDYRVSGGWDLHFRPDSIQSISITVEGDHGKAMDALVIFLHLFEITEPGPFSEEILYLIQLTTIMRNLNLLNDQFMVGAGLLIKACANLKVQITQAEASYEQEDFGQCVQALSIALREELPYAKIYPAENILKLLPCWSLQPLTFPNIPIGEIDPPVLDLFLSLVGKQLIPQYEPEIHEDQLRLFLVTFSRPNHLVTQVVLKAFFQSVVELPPTEMRAALEKLRNIFGEPTETTDKLLAECGMDAANKHIHQMIETFRLV